MPSFMPIGPKLWALEGYIQTDRQSFVYYIDCCFQSKLDRICLYGVYIMRNRKFIRDEILNIKKKRGATNFFFGHFLKSVDICTNYKRTVVLYYMLFYSFLK